MFLDWSAACEKTSLKVKVPKVLKIINIAIKSPISPTLLTMKAFIEALFAESFLYQNPINK